MSGITGAGVKDFAIGAAIIAAVGVVAYVGYKAYKAAGTVTGAVKGAAAALNPVNPDNVFNRGFNATVKAITGADSLYDALHSPKNSPLSGQGTTPGMSVTDLRAERAKIQTAIDGGIMWSGDVSSLQKRLDAIDEQITKAGGFT